MTDAPSEGGLLVRSPHWLKPDAARTFCRLFVPGEETLIQGESRAQVVIDRVLDLSDTVAERTLARTLARFTGRHRDLIATLERNFQLVADRLGREITAGSVGRQLIGACFTQEYAPEAAALFNPSMVEHPDQAGCEPGDVRFIMSLRAVGEGHLSSIEFRTGTMGADSGIRLDPPGGFLDTGCTHPVPGDRDLSRYTVEFDKHSAVSERVLWPAAPAESHGMEDARFVRFADGDGVTYYATYTAFDGSQVAPHLLETTDFRTFSVCPLTGPSARNKGMALFPRRIDGRYAALSRWDRESNAIAYSDDGRRWGEAVSIQGPAQPWELIQLGNCGSPIETPMGWLVFTHGVGPMREYAIGVALLDLEEPERLIAALPEPLLVAEGPERTGYVPNVVYSCGAMLHGGAIALPYGCSDSSVRFAIVDLELLLARLTR
ncbi:MAG TPA: glycoside hydrolase family 130 protein [Streptosporangiaceae bacterium]